MTQVRVLRIDDMAASAYAELRRLGECFGVQIITTPADEPIPGSYWGEPEAGIVGDRVNVRGDTPIHSLLHELCHIICMTPDRRRLLDTDARSDDDEEAAVCYLQIVLAGGIASIGRDRIMRDMDSWGYSFPEGDTRSWFEAAADTRAWLQKNGIVKARGEAEPARVISSKSIA